MGHHEGYVQQGPNSNRAVTIKQRRVLSLAFIVDWIVVYPFKQYVIFIAIDMILDSTFYIKVENKKYG